MVLGTVWKGELDLLIPDDELMLLSFCSSCLPREDFAQEEKARFGELCSGENGKGREWFAKYVSAQVNI